MKKRPQSSGLRGHDQPRAGVGGLGGCSGGSTSSSDTLTVAGDVPIAYAQRVNTIGLNPTDGTPVRRRRRPDAPREVVGERDRAQPHRPVHPGQGRRVRPRGVVRRQEDRLLDALPGEQHVDDRRRAGLHRPLEHLGIRHDRHGGSDRRHLPPPHRSTDGDDVDPAYLPAGTRLRVLVEPADQVEDQPGDRPRSTSALDEYERERVLNLHTMDTDGGDDRADLVQPEPRPQPGGAAERRHHVLALGARRRRATASRSSAPSPTAPTCSCSTARRARATASCTRATWTRRASTPASSRRPDVALGHAGRRRADVHRRGQLLRAEHAGQQRRAGQRRPVRGHRQAAQPGHGAVAVRPRSPRPIRSGTAPIACCSASGRAR